MNDEPTEVLGGQKSRSWALYGGPSLKVVQPAAEYLTNLLQLDRWAGRSENSAGPAGAVTLAAGKPPPAPLAAREPRGHTPPAAAGSCYCLQTPGIRLILCNAPLLQLCT